MIFVDELSDWLYIDEYIQKAQQGKESSADIYLNSDKEKVTIEFEITDLVRANNLINVLRYDHDGNVAKTLGVKMTRYNITPRERATELYMSLPSSIYPPNFTDRAIDPIQNEEGDNIKLQAFDQQYYMKQQEVDELPKVPDLDMRVDDV